MYNTQGDFEAPNSKKKNLSARVQRAPPTLAPLEQKIQSFEAQLSFSHLAHQELSKPAGRDRAPITLN